MNHSRLTDQSDDDVPESERGKGENMSLEERSPTMVFGVVGLSYFAVLLLVLGGIAVWFLV